MTEFDLKIFNLHQNYEIFNYKLFGNGHILCAAHVSAYWYYLINGYMCRYCFIPADRIQAGNLPDMKRRFIRSTAKMEIFILGLVEERMKGYDNDCSSLQKIGRPEIIFHSQLTNGNC